MISCAGTVEVEDCVESGFVFFLTPSFRAVLFLQLKNGHLMSTFNASESGNIFTMSNWFKHGYSTKTDLNFFCSKQALHLVTSIVRDYCW